MSRIPRLIEVTPLPHHTNLPTQPPRIALRFDRPVDREAIERAISVRGAAGVPRFRWKRMRPTRVSARSFSRLYPREQTPRTIEVDEHDWVELVFSQPFAAGETITVELRGEQPVRWTFQTRPPAGRAATLGPRPNRTTDIDPSQRPTRIPGRGGIPTIDETITGPARERRPVPAGTPPKRALVLGGGGAKGDFQIGAVRYLYEEEGFFPDVIVGTSIGALNGVKLAEARTPAEHLDAITQLQALWEGLESNDDAYLPDGAAAKLMEMLVGGLQLGSGPAVGVDWTALFPQVASYITGPVFGTQTGPFAGLIAGQLLLGGVEDAIDEVVALLDEAIRSDFVFNLEPARKLLDDTLAASFDRVIRPGLEFELLAVNLTDGLTHAFRRQDFVDQDRAALIDAVLASAGMPVIFPPVRTQDACYTDGGVREITGVRRAIELGATDIVVVPTSPASAVAEPLWSRQSRIHGILGIFFRAIFDVAFSEIGWGDIHREIERLELYNQFTGTDYRLRVIDPRYAIHDSLTFEPQGIRRAISYGRTRARQVSEGTPPALTPQPIQQTSTSALLVVRPLHTDGTLIRPKFKGIELEFVVEQIDQAPASEAGLYAYSKVIHEAPSERWPNTRLLVVPQPRNAFEEEPLVGASDPGYSDQLAIPGRFYAFPLHAPGTFRVTVTATKTVYVDTWSNAMIHVVPSQINGTLALNDTLTWEGGSGRFLSFNGFLKLKEVDGKLPAPGQTLSGPNGSVLVASAEVVNPGFTTKGQATVEQQVVQTVDVELKPGPDGTMDLDVPMGIDR